MITIKDVARECNVSFSTVSKALQGSKEISKETIEKIQQKAYEMGYQPNIAARTLRTNKTNDIAVIFEDKTGSGFEHQYFAKIISGLQQAAQSYNYDLTFTGHGKHQNYDYYNHIMSKNFDAVVILSANFEQEDLKKLVKSNIPLATLDYQYDQDHICVLSDNKQGMTELTEFVIQNGHTKLAFIYGEETLVTKDRKEAFLQTLKNHNIQIDKRFLIKAGYHNPSLSAQATKKILEEEEKPTCIFFPDDYSALGGIQEINQHKLKIGKDISIVGYDGILLTSMMSPPLTTFEQDGVKIGKKIVSLLIEQIQTKKIIQNQLVVSGKLLKGDTVATVK